ncbi:MAG TPA: dihydrofolate reductase family protein [Candidatus Dormibacteraeota bacterium]|nr:dihydrofolate reductase family protein [Candidatus Dormibacteraeota bacterium]
MRLVATEYVTLDGVFEEPGHWSFPYFDDDAMRFKADELETADAQLLGRKTYEGFAAAWPTMEGTGDFGVKMNTMPKYVVSSTLQNPTWTNTTVLKGDVAAAVRDLKAKQGRDLLLAGSGRLFNTLMRENLIDVYRLMVHPIVRGTGPRLFDDGTERKLELVDVKRFGKGVVVLEYVPADPPH